MKRYVIVLGMLLGAAVYAQRGGVPAQPGAPAAGGTPAAGQAGGRGRGQSPEQQAAAAAQAGIEQSVPQIPFDATALPLMPEGHTIGET